MSRFDGKLTAAGDADVEAAELLATLRGQRKPDARERQTAIARYLSGSNGWKDASNLLGGAFAPMLGSRLNGDKGE